MHEDIIKNCIRETKRGEQDVKRYFHHAPETPHEFVEAIWTVMMFIEKPPWLREMALQSVENAKRKGEQSEQHIQEPAEEWHQPLQYQSEQEKPERYKPEI